MTRPLIAAAAFLFAIATAGQAPAQTIRPDTDNDENLEYAASVAQLTFVPNQPGNTVKMFALAGGDPAMNGFQTYLAFYADVDVGWVTFRIGDFLDYRILSATAGRINVQVRENYLRGDEIATRVRRFSLRWTPGQDDAPPATVTMAPTR
ncbi:MAG TPA: hypothetical protein VGO55_01300 [Allosphingosinicella sp.]|jgi:hypothetical protein|nr:hypothetical protein [Allosphingosinicella sp.]